MRRPWPVLLLLLAGCATPPAPPLPADAAVAWQQRQPRLHALQDWQLTARVAVIQEPAAWHLKVQWKHTARGYEMLLAGPFGAGQVRLIGRAGEVLLEDGERHRWRARDPESLLYRQTGVYMPVSGLRYWIRGLPDPHKQRVSELQFDARGRLAELRQGDWVIRFQEYRPVDGLMLPRRLQIHRDDLEVRVVVDRWQLRKRGE